MSNNNKISKHRQRMQRQKELVDAGIARADEDRGIIVVNTGNGKGKSSSGFGMVARALGHGMRVAVVQFIKGSGTTGEENFFRRFPGVEYHVMGEGFTWETQDRERDVLAAQKAWQKACEFLLDERVGVVLLDELNIALKLKFLPVDDVVWQLQKRPRMQHVIVTGRAAPGELLDIADTVTDMREIKHAYKAGVRAQKGIEM